MGWITTSARAGNAAWPGAETMALFLLVVIVAIALGIVGVVVKGMLYLLVIGVVLFIADLVLVGASAQRRRRKPAR